MAPHCDQFMRQKALLIECIDTDVLKARALERGRLGQHRLKYKGAGFEAAADPDAYTITLGDLEALTLLNVGVSLKNREQVLQTEQNGCTELLRQIDPELALEDIPADRFEAVLGPESPTWRLWAMLRELPDQAPR